MQKSRFFQSVRPSRQRLLISTAPFVVAMAALSPASAQVSIGGDSSPSNPVLVDGSVDLDIGLNGPGTMTILNAATLTNATGFVGFDVGGVGVVTVSDQGSHWNNLGDLVIGQYGDGTLDILAGGVVTAETGYIGASLGGVGVVTVSGEDGLGNASTWSLRQDLDIGQEGTGTLNVTQGGHVTTTGRISAGSWGDGNVALSDGGTISSNDAILGVDGYGAAFLTSGASWTVANQFTVGLFSQGDLRIEDGASLVSRQGYVGANSGGDGSVVVTGAGSSWEMTNSNLNLGNYGAGEMTIEDGARVFAWDGVHLGASDVTASGTLNVLGTPGARGIVETSGFLGGAGTANVTVDGGIIRAIRDNTNFFGNYGAQQVTLGADGGIIDTDGHDISIAPVMSGAGSLTKEGLGTLTLTGANTYGGGTTITAGTLQLGDGGTSGSIMGDVANGGILAFNRSDAVTFGGTIAGTGGVWQVGTGKTTLTANSSGLSGVSRVYDGILSVNNVLGGSMEVLGGMLQGIGQVGTTTNFAGGTIAPGNSIGTLTVAGNYVGNGGILEIETILGDDSSATDLLAVTGDTSGSTNVRVINLGGGGAQTNEGIRIVDVGGMSMGDFTLLGDYNFEGDPAVVGGAYAYRLYQGGVTTPADGDWYLRSSLINGGTPTGPLYQAGAPVYETYATVLQSFNALETLQQRVGNRAWTADVIDVPEAAGANSGIWGRVAGLRASMDSTVSTTGADVNVGTWQLQAGADRQLFSGEAGNLVGGLSARYGTIAGDVTSRFGNGSISSTGYGLGGSLTWYGSDGFYLDSQANLTWYDSTLSSSTAATRLVSGNNGFGYALGVEAGQQIALAPNWSITPQAQLTYSDVAYDSFTDAFGAAVSLTESNDLTIRLGLSADYQNSWTDETGETSRLHAYGIANLYYDVLPHSRTDLAGVEFVNRQDNLRGGLGIGGTYTWGGDKYAIHSQAGINTSLYNFGSSYSLAGTVGLTVKF